MTDKCDKLLNDIFDNPDQKMLELLSMSDDEVSNVFGVGDDSDDIEIRNRLRTISEAFNAGRAYDIRVSTERRINENASEKLEECLSWLNEARIELSALKNNFTQFQETALWQTQCIQLLMDKAENAEPTNVFSGMQASLNLIEKAITISAQSTSVHTPSEIDSLRTRIITQGDHLLRAVKEALAEADAGNDITPASTPKCRQQDRQNFVPEKNHDYEEVGLPRRYA